MNNHLYIIILIAIVIALLMFIYILTNKGFKQVKKDWETYHELEERVKNVSTKDQANIMYVNLIKFKEKLNNSIIDTRISYLFAFLDGFLKAKQNE